MGIMNELDIEKSLREEDLNQCREEGSILEPKTFCGKDGISRNLDAVIKDISSQEHHKPGAKRRITEREFDSLVDKHGNAEIVYRVYGISPEDIDYGEMPAVEKQNTALSLGKVSLANTVSHTTGRQKRHSTRRNTKTDLKQLSDYDIPDDKSAPFEDSDELFGVAQAIKDEEDHTQEKVLSGRDSGRDKPLPTKKLSDFEPVGLDNPFVKSMAERYGVSYEDALDKLGLNDIK